MTLSGIERVRQILMNAEDVTFDIGDQVGPKVSPEAGRHYLPQMPQLPQVHTSSNQVLSDDDDTFEERAAIIEYDGELPRKFAEFLARQQSQT